MAFFNKEMSILKLSLSLSTKTGILPLSTIAFGTTTHVYAGHIISQFLSCHIFKSAYNPALPC